MIPTADPNVFIETRRDGYVVYYDATTKERWEVIGYCDRRGDCLIGSNVKTPDGLVEVRDHEHIEELKRLLGKERIDSEMDVPVRPGFSGCCPLVAVEL